MGIGSITSDAFIFQNLIRSAHLELLEICLLLLDLSVLWTPIMKKLLNITQCQIQKSILLGAAKCIIYCLSQIILIILIAQTNGALFFFLN